MNSYNEDTKLNSLNCINISPSKSYPTFYNNNQGNTTTNNNSSNIYMNQYGMGYNFKTNSISNFQNS